MPVVIVQVAAGVLAVEERPWDDIPGVALVGIMVGVALLATAIRAMFDKKGK